MLTEHLHILVSPVVDCIPVHGAIKRPNVVVIGISLREAAAFDVNIMD